MNKPNNFKKGNNQRNERTEKHIINRAIQAQQVRLVGDGTDKAGEIISTHVAQRKAEELGLDLVLISPQANPPVAKIIDYRKFMFDVQKREKEQQKLQKENNKELKEIRFTSNTGENDVETKKKKIREFLEDGHKVKLVVRFMGRNIVYTDRGEIILLKIAEEMAVIAKPDALPKLQDKNMSMTLTPKK